MAQLEALSKSQRLAGRTRRELLLHASTQELHGLRCICSSCHRCRHCSQRLTRNHGLTWHALLLRLELLLWELLLRELLLLLLFMRQHLLHQRLLLLLLLLQVRVHAHVAHVAHVGVHAWHLLALHTQRRIRAGVGTVRLICPSMGPQANPTSWSN